MPYIRVKIDTLHDAFEDLSQVAQKVSNIESSFTASYQKINWEVKNKADVSSRVQNISRNLNEQQAALLAMSAFLDESYVKYAKLSHINPEGKEASSGRKGSSFHIGFDASKVEKWVSDTAKKWMDTFKTEVEDWMEHLKEEQKDFIDKWTKILDVNNGDYSQKLVAIMDLLNHPVESAVLSLRWIVYRGSQEGWFEDIFSALDFERSDDGIYHVNVDKYKEAHLQELLQDKDGICWQQLAGYTELYDYVFDAFCDMEARNDIRFTTDSGETYTIWLWKGEYLNLGAGGELGIYKGDGEFLQCATDVEPKISLHVDYKDPATGKHTSSDWSDETWWVTSFNPSKQDYKPEDLTLTYTVDFSEVDPEIWAGFLRLYRTRGGIDGVSVDTKTKTAVITY